MRSWRRRAASVLTGLALLVPSGPAPAQTADPKRHLQAFVASGLHRGLVSRAIAGIPNGVFRRCPSLVSDGSRVTMLQPLSFGADGLPDGGSWREAFPVRGCGNDTTLNLYLFATPAERINVVVGLPGSTHAGLLLQKDAMPMAETGALLAVPGCKAFEVDDTRFAGADGVPPAPATGAAPPWREVWTMAGCGRVLEVPMLFTPDPTGTVIVQPHGVVVR